jgi:peptidoglycan/LPS O-acetylase OafA/YrhL
VPIIAGNTPVTPVPAAHSGSAPAVQSDIVTPSRAPPPLAWPARYELLDGIRGVAALAVVLHHLGVGQTVQIGHFAVMIFFVISGYCITASVESCRRSGAGFREFMLKRLRRIYPPYILAIVFFAVTRWVKSARNPSFEFKPPFLDWVQNLTLTQWVSTLFHPTQWPAQNHKVFVAAFWSLNYEEQFYLVMGLALVVASLSRVPIIISVLTVSIVGLVWNWLIPGNWICGLFTEYWLHFALGSTLFYVLCRFTSKAHRAAFLIVIAVLGIACLSRVLLHTANVLFDMRAMIELSFLSAITLMLYFLRPLSRGISRLQLWRPFAALGAISYSLYLIHQFNLTLVDATAHKLLPANPPQVLLVMCSLALFLLLATMFWALCERPFLRKNLKDRDLISSVRQDVRTA